METSSVTSVAATLRGKSAQSIGHQAKQAVAEARASGIDLPKNAQGFAASSISQGVDPASLFAAVSAPDEAADSDAVTSGTAGEQTVTESEDDGTDTEVSTTTSTEPAEETDAPVFEDTPPAGAAAETTYNFVSLTYSATIAVLSQPATQSSGETALALLDTRV